MQYGWFDCFSPKDEPMTHHFVLPTADFNGLVWVTEDSAFLGEGNRSSVEKIRYAEDQEMAWSAWGDFSAIDVGERLSSEVAGGLDLSDTKSSIAAISRIGLEMLPANERGVVPRHELSRGLIVASLREPVRLYQGILTWRPKAFHMTGKIIAGDLPNFANLVPYYYYEQSGKSISECLLIGLHGMRLANKLNSNVIGSPYAWIFHMGKFRRLPPAELEVYIRLSESMDAELFKAFKNAPIPAEPSM